MKNKKAVILIAFFLFAIPFIYSAEQDCTQDNEGAIINNELCFCEGASCSLQAGPPNLGTIFRIREMYDVIYSTGLGYWYACDAKGDGSVAGTPLTTGQTINVNNQQYLCYLNENSEELAVCNGEELGKGALVNNVYWYCSADGNWVSRITDSATCTAAGLSWTGNQCCGYDFMPQYYNDWLGGCWNGNVIWSLQRVSDANLAPGFEDKDGDMVPDKWQRRGIPNAGGHSALSLGNSYYEISVPPNAERAYYGLWSDKINIRKNTLYNLSIAVSTLASSEDSGAFYALNLRCYGSNSFRNFVWVIQPGPIQGTTNWKTIHAMFRTTATTTYCQVTPTWEIGASGLARFNNVELSEINPYVLNKEGQFYACRKTNADFGLTNNLLNEDYNSMCIYLDGASHYCSGTGWVYTTEPGPFHLSRIIPEANLLVNPLFKLR